MTGLPKLWKFLLKLVRLYPVVGLSAVFLAGTVFWGGLNWSMELANTQAFCISCHEMEDNVYKEYLSTAHYHNRTGVRASCPDCHVPQEWIHKVVRKVGATNELLHWLIGSIDTREKFEAKRSKLAQLVWTSMEATDSRECRNCHGFGFMTEEVQSAGAGLMHSLAQEWDMTCIDCHKGIAHDLPREFDNSALMDELHDRMEKQELDCRQCHEDMAGPPKGEGW
jgi:cytochrome c-type protein NapC